MQRPRHARSYGTCAARGPIPSFTANEVLSYLQQTFIIFKWCDIRKDAITCAPEQLVVTSPSASLECEIGNRATVVQLMLDSTNTHRMCGLVKHTTFAAVEIITSGAYELLVERCELPLKPSAQYPQHVLQLRRKEGERIVISAAPIETSVHHPAEPAVHSNLFTVPPTDQYNTR